MTRMVGNIVNLVRLLSRSVLHVSDRARILNPVGARLGIARVGWLI